MSGPEHRLAAANLDRLERLTRACRSGDPRAEAEMRADLPSIRESFRWAARTPVDEIAARLASVGASVLPSYLARDEWTEWLDVARASAERLGDRRSLAIILSAHARSAEGSGRFVEALRSARLATRVGRVLGDARVLATAVGALGEALVRLGQLRRAVAVHAKQVELATASGDAEIQAEAQNDLGFALYHAGKRECAATVLEHAIQRDLVDLVDRGGLA